MNEFPNKLPQYPKGNPNGYIQIPYCFLRPYLSADKKRESGNGVSKVCPHRDAQEFFQKHTHSSIQNSCAPLTQRESSPKLRTPKGAAEKLRIRILLLGFGWVLLGYNTDFVRTALIAKKAPLWYNNMDRQAKIIFLPAACAAPLCFRKAALCLNTALANHCKQVRSLALWKHKQAERFHITENECILTVGIRCAEVAGRRRLRRARIRNTAK